MTKSEIIAWLLDGDVAIQYQVHRDLLQQEKPNLRKRIAHEGYGKKILSKQNQDGHWGQSFYQPKWISTHYSLLDLRNLCILPVPQIIKSISSVLLNLKAADGGIRLGPSTSLHSDVCVNAMVLNYASYFGSTQEELTSIVDGILNEQMNDGGYNCLTTRTGARHSSLHTSISVLEGFEEYIRSGYAYRSSEIKTSQRKVEEFILDHRLFRSDKTGQIIKREFLKFPYPSRWKYDILRALDYFQYAKRPYDKRMDDAIEVLLQKRTKHGLWKLNSPHPGQVHVVMEKAGKASRWNTLRALRVLEYYGIT